MNLIIYPSEQVINTYLCIGFSVEMYISYDGDTVMFCNSDQDRPSESYLSENGYKHLDLNEFYKVSLSKDYAQWDFKCPINYKQIDNKIERQKSYYIDGMSKISYVLAKLNYFTSIQINKPNIEPKDCKINFNSH